jgi:hypothetical protein
VSSVRRADRAHQQRSPEDAGKNYHACVRGGSRRGVELEELLSATGTMQLQWSVFARGAALAEAGGWTSRTVGSLLRGLHQVLGSG